MGGVELANVWLIGGTVLWLVFLEGLLSADNALVLAMMVRHLPKPEQKRALRYGIWGAFAFRVVAVFLANLLLHVWYLKVIGGVYLIYLTVAHVLSRGDDDADAAGKAGRGFWSTVFKVELADIAFSVDSILAAVAVAESLPPTIGPNIKYGVVIAGGILGIITMRFVAGYFIILLERFKGLEAGAYGLVAWIGIKLAAGGLHKGGLIRYELDERAFWIGMLVIVAIGFVYQPRARPPKTLEEDAVVEQVTRLAGGESEGGRS